MSNLDEKIAEILLSVSAGVHGIDDALAEIKAAVLAEMPAKISTTNDHDYYHGEVSGYNQAITEITEKLK